MCMQLFGILPFCLLAGLSLARAAPVNADPIIVFDADHIVNLGEEPNNRIIAVVMCIVYAFLLAFAQGFRAGRMVGRSAGTRLSDVLVFFQGFVCTAFLFAVCINTSGLGLSSDKQCWAAIRVCIVLYGAAKIALALFLLERIHVIRSPFVDRFRDPFWVIGAIVTLCAYGVMTALQFIDPESELSRKDGHCRIGIQPRAAVATILVDTITNLTFTGIFIWQLRPLLATEDVSTRRRTVSILKLLWPSKEPASLHSAPLRSLANVRSMLYRNIIGCIILLVNVVVNNAMFLTWGFARLSHACQLMCLTDIVVGMLITQWLSMRAAIENSAPVQHASGPDSAGSGTRSRRQTIEGWRPTFHEAAPRELKPVRLDSVLCKQGDAAHPYIR